MSKGEAELVQELDNYIARSLGEGVIDEDRRMRLKRISDFVVSRLADGQPARLVFICTHNSRRSQLCQCWAGAAAHHFAISPVETFSGGTETTAFNARAVAALRRAGFEIDFFSDGKNPVYEVRFGPGTGPIQAFSKIYDEPPNPNDGFAAIMTCSSADAACPIVVGADERIAIPYDDPKIADGTERESEIYDERCRQIAREMLFVFREVSRRM